MPEITPAHFSKKILVVSLLFMLVNLAWFGVVSLTQKQESFKAVAPVLKFVSSVDTIDIKSPYDQDFRSAVEEQELVTGTVIRTGEGEFAEVTLESNIVRLDENTEVVLLENNFTEQTAFEIKPPRLIFALTSGSVWVNAFDTIAVKTAQSNVRLGHSIGIVTYSAPMNRVVMVTGNSDLELLDANGKMLTQFMIPLHSQVTFADSQITPEYAKLKPSKLKKELKLGSVSQNILDNEWVQRNSNMDSRRFSDSFKLILGENEYKIKSALAHYRSWFTFIPQSRTKLALERLSLDLRYLLGYVHQQGDTALAETLLSEMPTFTAGIESDPGLRKLFSETFFAIGGVKFGSPAYMAKEYLMENLVRMDGPEILTVYLGDVRSYLADFNLEDAEAATTQWVTSWQPYLSSENLEEYTHQSQILHRILLANADKVTPGMLDAFDQTGVIQISMDDSEEVRLAVTEDRLLLAASLVSNYRYIAAKQYLKSSYDSLSIETRDEKIASVEIFLEQARLLAQRIQFAEERLYGAATEIDETEFQNYLAQKTLSEQVSEDLKAFFQTDTAVEKTTEAPSKADVVSKFLEARVNITESDLTSSIENPFVFTVQDAYLMDRSADGSLVVFSASYDYLANAVAEVTVNGNLLKGSFALNDLVSILKENGIVSTGTGDSTMTNEDILGLLSGDQNDEALRIQITAEGLAKQLAISELTKLEIKIPDPSQVSVLDTVTLTRFAIAKALITDSITSKDVAISFEYNSSTKLATNVRNADSGQLLTDGILAADIKSFIEKSSYQQVIIKSSVGKVTEFMEAQGLLLTDQDLTPDENGIVELSGIRAAGLPITVKGTFDLNTGKLTRLSHALLEQSDPDVAVYFTALGRLYVLSYLQQNGITVPEENLTLTYPIEKIQVENFKAGDKTYSFTVDLAGNQLKDVVLLETGAKVASMTLAEFKSLLE